MKPFYVYILQCRDGSYYTGHTDDIEKRLHEHLTNKCFSYTAKRRPFKLVFCDTTTTRYEAMEAERKIKGWSRAKKEALIKGDWEKIVELSNQKNNLKPIEQ